MAEFDLKENSLSKLVETLNQIVTLYRQLLIVVRNEKEILISADLDLLNENNKIKEDLILKIKASEKQRALLSKKLAEVLKIDTVDPKLKVFFNYLTDSQSEKLRSLQTVLEVLIKRVSDLNKFNEQLVKSALDNITGAMSNIKKNLSAKSIYQKKGNIKSSKARSGQLVSKEI